MKWMQRSRSWLTVGLCSVWLGACGSDTGTVTTVPGETSNPTTTQGQGQAAFTSALFDGDGTISLDDAAEMLAVYNLPADGASEVAIATAARILLLQEEALAPIQNVPSLVNADIAAPAGVLNLTDIAVVLSALQTEADERTDEAIAARVTQLLDDGISEPFPADDVRVIPGQERLGEAGQPGGPAIVVGEATEFTNGAIGTINGLPISITSNGNVSFPPGTEILFPAAPDPNQALQVSFDPPLTPARNDVESISFTAEELNCDGNSCSLDGIAIIPAEIDPAPNDYVLTYTFRYSDGADGAIEESVQRVLTVLEAAEPFFENLVSFDGINGSQPLAGLLLASDGNFYGTTSLGGASDLGTLFRMTPEGDLTKLVDFDGSNGSTPVGRLIEASDGNFYGTTRLGGSSNLGTIFQLTPSGDLTTLVQFVNNGRDGFRPQSPLLEASDGNFYGTTSEGGAFVSGTVFRMTPEGVLETLVSLDTRFDGSNEQLDSDAAVPDAGLIEANDGNFYGTTRRGGSNGEGVVFQVSPEGDFATFASLPERNRIGGDAEKRARLLEASDGNFYGATPDGGSTTDRGVIFRLTPTGELTRLVIFEGSPNGSNPAGGLIEAIDGNFYGTTRGGGNLTVNNVGTIYRVTPDGLLSTLFSFSRSNNDNGDAPIGELVEASDGSLYGVTRVGGTNFNGTIFRYSP
ncbi:MAG: choice-of-anchor tandem repeat GloVer-containing protein [Cyanobacteria bacterium P01_D01_bin.123]